MARASPALADVSELRVYLLGAFRLESATGLIHLPRRKVESLLAYLILHPGPHARQQLATLLWGDSSDAQARHSLRTALFFLTRQLGTDLLRMDREGVQLNPVFPLWVDAHELMDLPLGLSALGEIQAKLALVRGELLAGLYDDWITPEREHVRTWLLAALLQLTQALRAHSEYEQAIKFAQQALAIDPANEPAHQHLMFCYMATGDRSAALRQYEACARTLRAELDVAPLPATSALYRWIQQSSAEQIPHEAQITNLPIPLTSFIGRKQAMADLKRLLLPAARQERHLQGSGQNVVRLLTLTGAGGSGKTRLAVQVATDLIDAYTDGVWWVELAALANGALVVQAVAKTVGVKETPNEPLIDTLARFLYTKQLLLVIDNCEHLVDACAQFAADVLSVCPQVQILATSRAALNTAGERIWQVPMLSAPDPKQLALADLLMQYEGMRLFVERAVAVQQDFALTPNIATTVAEICQRLAGLPLAIELAAARVKVLAPAQMVARLDDCLRVLTGGSRTAPTRQQTLRATLDWSYDLLSATEQTLFQRLSVFAGGFTLEAAETMGEVLAPSADVAQDEVAAPIQTTLELLAYLVDKSLVLAEPQGEAVRYRLLEPIRQYARDRLLEAGESEAMRGRHARYYLAFAEAGAPKLYGAQQTAWLDRLERDHDNFRAVLLWSQEHATGTDRAAAEVGLRLASALGQFWIFHSYFSEGRGWLATMLALNAPVAYTPARAKALATAGWLACSQADYASAHMHFAASVEIGRAVGSAWDLAFALAFFGVTHWLQGDFALGRTRLEESLALFQALDDRWGIATAASHLGLVVGSQGDFVQAAAWLERALQLHREVGDTWGIAQTAISVGFLMVRQGNYERATSLQEEGRMLFRQVGDTYSMAHAIQNLADIARHEGDLVRSTALSEESLALFRQSGNKWGMAGSLGDLAAVAQAQADYGRAATLFVQSLALYYEIGDQGNIPGALEGLAGVAAAQDQPVRAAHLGGAAAALRTAVSAPLTAYEQAHLDGLLTPARQALGDIAFAETWAAGHALTLEQAIQLALT